MRGDDALVHAVIASVLAPVRPTVTRRCFIGGSSRPRVVRVGVLTGHVAGALGQRYLLWKVAWPMPSRARLARPSRRSWLVMMSGPSARVTGRRRPLRLSAMREAPVW